MILPHAIGDAITRTRERENRAHPALQKTPNRFLYSARPLVSYSICASVDQLREMRAAATFTEITHGRVLDRPYGKYLSTFADFQAAVQEVWDQAPTTQANQLASLTTLKFQKFENVSLMTA